jgi:AraC-like DNA-binding protein
MLYHIENKKYPYFVGNMPGLGNIPHIHSHLEMVYICQGSAIATADDRSFEIGPGDLFLAFPNQIHYYEKREPVNIYLTIFSDAIHPQLQALLAGRLPVCPVLKKQVLPQSLPEELAAVSRLSRSSSAYDRMAATGQLLAILGRLLPLFSYREAPEDHDNIKRILGYCMEHYTEPLTLDILARELYLSKFYISHVFTGRMGISFPRFLGKLRVDHACKLLEKKVSVTQAAYAAGFSSVRTFNRVFQNEKGLSPREYRKQIP